MKTPRAVATVLAKQSEGNLRSLGDGRLHVARGGLGARKDLGFKYLYRDLFSASKSQGHLHYTPLLIIA